MLGASDLAIRSFFSSKVASTGRLLLYVALARLLLDDLQRHKPVLVALQKEEWRSYDAFMQNDSLRTWLETGYTLDRESPEFSVWRLKGEGRE